VEFYLPRAAARTVAILYARRHVSEAACASGAWTRRKRVRLFPRQGDHPLDDNIASDMEYAKTLFRALTPHRKWWSSQASIHAAQDDEFLELAASSGCKQLFVGLESISQSSVNEVRKRFNRVSDYGRAIERIHSHGIAVQAGIVFGFDNDGPTIFGETLDFLEAAGVQKCNLQHPYSLSRNSAVPASGRRGPDSDARLE